MHTEGTVKYIVFRDWTQFENDARGLMKHYRPYLPSGYPTQENTPTGKVIKQKFEQRGPRLTYEMIDFHIDKLIKTMELCFL